MSWNANDYDQEVFEVRAGIVHCEDYEAEHACHHGETIRDICDASPDDTRKCDGCDRYHCAAHLKDGYCAECDAYAEADIAASAAAALAAPVAIAIGGWLNAIKPAAAPRYAAIGNGLFVRVGTGRKTRRAA